MTDSWDMFATPTQGIVKTHGSAACAGETCCVHNPSDHHMRDWPLVFNMNKAGMGERVCEHFVKHPDPDAVAHFKLKFPIFIYKGLVVHNCCGCCIIGKETE